MKHRSADLKKFPLTPGEHDHLKDLYMTMGAWTYGEGLNALGQERFQELLRGGLLGRQETDMGPVFHLMAPGRLRVFGTADGAASFASQLDQCYLRLCMTELKWREVTRANPVWRGLTEFAPTGKFVEAQTDYGTVLLTGRLTGGSYSPDQIKTLASKIKATALNKSIMLVFLTPSKRKGHAMAQTFSNFIRLHHHLPRTATNPDFKRFVKVQPYLANDHGPALTPIGVATEKRTKHPRPDLSLETLSLGRKGRIEQAMNALICDGVITAHQLGNHYALRTGDLPGYLQTHTLVRPKGKSCLEETATTILVTHPRMTRLSDEILLHRIGLAETRQELSIPPDPERWIVEPGGRKGIELPDALYHDLNGETWAVEFDPGHYAFNTIDNKLQSFHDGGYENIIYSVTSPVRQQNITRRFASKLKTPPLLVQWWKPR